MHLDSSIENIIFFFEVFLNNVRIYLRWNLCDSTTNSSASCKLGEEPRSDSAMRRSAVARLAYPIADVLDQFQQQQQQQQQERTIPMSSFDNVVLVILRSFDDSQLHFRMAYLYLFVSHNILPFKNTKHDSIDFYRTKNSRWTESTFFFILSPMYEQLLHSTYITRDIRIIYATRNNDETSHRIDPIV